MEVEQNVPTMSQEEASGYDYDELVRDLYNRSCMQPMTIYIRGQPMEVPCGKCWICEKKRKSQWVLRLSMEAKYAKCSFWLTLTYDESNVPLATTTKYNFNANREEPDETLQVLDKRDHQLFLKLLRKRLGKCKLRYFLVGEYGPSSYRPHYHCLLFLDSYVDYWIFDEYVKASWTKGFYMLKKPTFNQINYCAKYSISIPNLPDIYKRIAPQYMACSKGIGRAFLTNDIKIYYNNLLRDEDKTIEANTMVSNGYKYALPRYYKNRIFGKFEKNQIGHKIQTDRARKTKNKQQFFKDALEYERDNKNPDTRFISYCETDTALRRNLEEQGRQWREKNMKKKKI